MYPPYFVYLTTRQAYRDRPVTQPGQLSANQREGDSLYKASTSVRKPPCVVQLSGQQVVTTSRGKLSAAET